jgi:hypothetical protein
MAELEASAASMSTADHVDDVACSGHTNQPPPAGAVHDAALAGQIRSVTWDGRLDDRASGEAPSASMEPSSDATTSTPCPKCANRHARTKHTCGKARNAPSVLAAPARASRRSRSATEPVADQPASQSPRFATAHASARSARDDGSSTSSNAPVTQSPTGPHDVEMQEAKRLRSPGVAPSTNFLDIAWQASAISEQDAFRALGVALHDAITARMLGDTAFSGEFDIACARFEDMLNGPKNGLSSLQRVLRRLRPQQIASCSSEWPSVFGRWQSRFTPRNAHLL